MPVTNLVSGYFSYGSRIMLAVEINGTRFYFPKFHIPGTGDNEVCEDPPYPATDYIHNLKKIREFPPYTGNCKCENIDASGAQEMPHFQGPMHYYDPRKASFWVKKGCRSFRVSAIYGAPQEGSVLADYASIGEVNGFRFSGTAVSKRDITRGSYCFFCEDGIFNDGTMPNIDLCCITDVQVLDGGGNWQPVTATTTPAPEISAPTESGLNTIYSFFEDNNVQTNFWFDPFYDNLIEHSGDNRVSGWNAHVGTGKIIQSNTGSQPTRGATLNIISSGLSFDNSEFLSGQLLNSPTIQSYASGNVGYFIVADIKQVDSGKDNLISFIGSGQTFDFNAGSDNNFAGRIETSGINDDNVTSTNLNPGAPFNAGPSIYHIAFDYSNNQLSSSINGINQSSINVNYNNSLQQSGIFNFGSGISGVIGDILSYNQSEYQRELEGIMAYKWGLQHKLPPNHPYRNSLPTGSGSS
jgi:hypothetical protein